MNINFYKTLVISGGSLLPIANKLIENNIPNKTLHYNLELISNPRFNKITFNSYDIIILLIPSELIDDEIFGNLYKIHEFAILQPLALVIPIFTIEGWSDLLYDQFHYFKFILINNSHGLSNYGSIVDAIIRSIDKFKENQSEDIKIPNVDIKVSSLEIDKEEQQLLNSINENKASKSPKFHLLYTGKTLPKAFWTLTHLTELAISYTPNLLVFPSEIIELVNLKELVISSGGPKQLPPEIAELKSLRSIFIFEIPDFDIKTICLNLRINSLSILRCGVKKLPAEINRLKLLTSLNLHGNNISKLPKGLFDLKYLVSLNCSSNKITSIPTEIYKLENLLYLDLSHNQIKELPLSLPLLSSLRDFNLYQNKIEYIPKEFFAFKNHIHVFNYTGNPLSDMPELLDMSLYQALNHLEKLSGKVNYNSVWEVPPTLSTAFQQYLNAFADFVFGLKGVEIKFDVIKIENGIKLTVEPNNKITIDEINELLESYFNNSTEIEELKEITRQQKAKIDALTITWQNDRNNFLNKIQLLKHTNQMLAASVGNMSAFNNELEEESFNSPLFNDHKQHSIQLNYGEKPIISLQIGPASLDTKSSSFDPDKFLDDLIECLKTQCSRKLSHKDEDLHNDNLKDLLEARGYNIADQTRHGGSAKKAGELDLLVRSNSGSSLSIIEGFKAASAGAKDTNISSHINKLLHKYDTAGHEVNFIVVYAEAAQFQKFWKTYCDYLEDLNHKPDFDKKYELKIFKDTGRTNLTNIRVGIAKHDREGIEVLVYHVVADMYCSPVKS